MGPGFLFSLHCVCIVFTSIPWCQDKHVINNINIHFIFVEPPSKLGVWGRTRGQWKHITPANSGSHRKPQILSQGGATGARVRGAEAAPPSNGESEHERSPLYNSNLIKTLQNIPRLNTWLGSVHIFWRLSLCLPLCLPGFLSLFFFHNTHNLHYMQKA